MQRQDIDSIAPRILAFPTPRDGTEPLLSKAQLAAREGRSTRWVELMIRDAGMPHHRDRNGRARFRPSEVDQWRRGYEERKRSGERAGAPTSREPALRRQLEELEQRVAALERREETPTPGPAA